MSFFNIIEEKLKEKNVYLTGTYEQQSINILLPEEKEIIAYSAVRRQNDFATGRWCTREVLKKMNIINPPILTGPEGEPIWPTGVCGSITHTKNAYCAVAAFTKDYQSLGIDIESTSREISEGVAKHILTASEEQWLLKENKDNQKFLRIIFCAKESIFKLFYPLVKSRFAFSLVSILPIPEAGFFSFILNKDLNHQFKKNQIFKGLYFQDDNWCFSLCSL